MSERNTLMNDKLRESLSALMDDNANELELERLLKHSGDGELRATWMRYHAARSSLSGQAVSQLSVDISTRVREAIDSESAVGAQTPATRPLGKAIASFAVAASVAAVVVVGGLQFGGGSDDFSAPPVVAGAVTPVGLSSQAGAVPVSATYGTQAVPARAEVRAAYRELARQRMQQFMQEHAEQAALNSPQGLMPYARVERFSP
jgi:sigma-E factor negative regulatory protein RseA